MPLLRPPGVVRPRVRSIRPALAEPVLLEDLILDLLHSGKRGIVLVEGGPGSGKSTAVRYLQELLAGEPDLVLLDTPDDPLSLKDLAHSRLVLCAHHARTPLRHLARLTLCPWASDDRIEYLLGKHPERCASVMRRLGHVERPSELGGIPELWSVVLDEMARDESLVSVEEALLRRLLAGLPDPIARKFLSAVCRFVLLEPRFDPRSILEGGEDARRLLRHRPVQVLLAARETVEDLAKADSVEWLARRFPADLLSGAAPLLRRSEAALERLRGIARGPDPRLHASAASLLNASDRRAVAVLFENHAGSARPRLDLSNARLAGADLRGVRAPSSIWTGADLYRVDLSSADLERALLSRANLTDANLRGARLLEADAVGSELRGANLSGIVADGLKLSSADLSGARLAGARLRQADLKSARLEGADLSGADLSQANLLYARLEGANLTSANLEAARLSGLRLAGVLLQGARFRMARMEGCHGESLRLVAPDFAAADLSGAYLTGSVLPRASFHGANLSGAGLADVEWEGVDLRCADLTHASFHLGSSRSGLVFNAMPGEGSRTGFYTDEFLNQGFKAAEDIRKANLRFADLRGARIEDTDFYLVDLRGARLDGQQVRHLRRCGAILEDRG